MHTTHCVSHTIRSRTSSHVVWVQCTTSTTTRSNREIRLASKHALLLVCTSCWVLETCWVCRVTCDRNVYTFLPHDSYTLAYIVSAIAVYLSTRTIRVSNALNLLKFACEIVKLCLHICKAVDTCDNLSCVLAQSVEDYAQRLLAYLVCLSSNLDSTLSCSK